MTKEMPLYKQGRLVCLRIAASYKQMPRVMKDLALGPFGFSGFTLIDRFVLPGGGITTCR